MMVRVLQEGGLAGAGLWNTACRPRACACKPSAHRPLRSSANRQGGWLYVCTPVERKEGINTGTLPGQKQLFPHLQGHAPHAPRAHLLHEERERAEVGAPFRQPAAAAASLPRRARPRRPGQQRRHERVEQADEGQRLGVLLAARLDLVELLHQVQPRHSCGTHMHVAIHTHTGGDGGLAVGMGGVDSGRNASGCNVHDARQAR